ncbi:MAG: aldose 1-epimerase family protein [Mariniblastus sp.]|nr:aldose 1-epimerase family protein [Mariniblastus sp.]
MNLSLATLTRALILASLIGTPLAAQSDEGNPLSWNDVPRSGQQPEGVSYTFDLQAEVDGVPLTPRSGFPADHNWSVTKQTLHGGMQEGVQLIEVDNGAIRFTIIPTRGMSIYNVVSGDLELGWQSPVKQMVHPHHIDLNDHGGLGWLAGFNELMVRCGVAFAGHPGEDDGKMLTLHGRIGNIPAHDVSIAVDSKPPYRIRVRGKVSERMFKFSQFDLWTEVSTVPGSHSIQINDVLVNRSDYAQEYQIIYHTNFGRPLLEQGAQFVAPVKTLAPFDAYAAKDLPTYATYLGPTPNYGEQVYCATLFSDAVGQTAVMLKNAAGQQGAGIQYATGTLPYFTLWKNTDTESDGYVTGLEPGTGYPYNRSVERGEGRVPKLAAGQHVRFALDIEVLQDRSAVERFQQQIKKLQGNRQPAVSETPPRTETEEPSQSNQ